MFEFMIGWWFFGMIGGLMILIIDQYQRFGYITIGDITSVLFCGIGGPILFFGSCLFLLYKNWTKTIIRRKR